MKKILVLTLSCLGSVSIYAQSTCETRVDAHQKATTNQRVAYCLTPDYMAPDSTYSELVFSGVSTRNTQTAPATTVRTTTKPGRFAPEKVSVYRSYIPSTQFPELSQDYEGQPVDEATVMVSSTYTPAPVTQTGTTVAQANLAPAPQEQFMYVTSPMVPPHPSTLGNSALQPAEHAMLDEAAGKTRTPYAQPVYETKAGLKARQTKPNRRVIAALVPAPEPAVSTTQTEPVAQTGSQEQPSTQPSVDMPEDLTQTYTPDTLSDNTYTEIPVDTTGTETSY